MRGLRSLTGGSVHAVTGGPVLSSGRRGAERTPHSGHRGAAPGTGARPRPVATSSPSASGHQCCQRTLEKIHSARIAPTSPYYCFHN